ncbi:AbrB family transcriptional regulator [Lactobacillus crispatus]|jgi:hypothetical protein|uniref:AbrB family transcriptional regulator n=2 Tax=Lactobacillus crispatus TaxID=47770 RepID=A0A135YM46_9LACO|nr:AbrB family transcriptional regulator [Lactobacillus crispatus]EEU20055.1 putative toxin-antitoxin system, antitoxin component, AbrB family [Lactobacillus crispatus 125-2-CHN]EEX29566.1 putative toxin-antitoxin system, antitoxin component, AbrB family [Lactobacillus crispatus MV-3A-US]KWU03342.1 AbrB family transcriptional regulator [Lactobacillus crispatus]KWU11932.1 AbrB family transcriptional regulator [Lactobacillus crispatus]
MAKQVIKMLQDTTKVFKAGNSLSVRLTKQDLTKFHVEDGTVLEKEYDPNGKKITFKIVDSINPNLDNFIDQFYEENKELTRELENK